MHKRSHLKLAALGAVAMGAVTFAAGASAAQDSTDPIQIALFDWTSVNLNAKILGGILEQLGNNVEYPTGDYLSSLTTSLTNGDVDVAMEYWDTTAGEAMQASDATGMTERLGPLGPQAKEEWWYPTYMKELCPGLPNWEALKDPACAASFSTPETAPMGRYVGGPVTWEGFDDERVKALDLPFIVIHAGTDAAMFAELDSAYQRKAPIMVWVYSAECYADPSVGINPDLAYDCGKPFGNIWKYSWAGMKDQWPTAYKVAKNYTMDTADLNAMSGKIDLDGMSIEDVAAEWIATNEATWRAWAN
jgi:glycine betaine/proline transport system substrate-binding protein